MKSVALIFPGQGAQSVGMGKEFYDASPEAKAVFDEADTVINGLSDVIFNGPAEKLTSTAFCQPGIFTFSMAALAAFKAHSSFLKFQPAFAAGLSLGEYSALCAAGVLSVSDTLKLVERRSFFMEEATKMKKGAMAAIIGFEKDKLVAICEQTGAEVANFNTSEQIVITGEAEKVAAASKEIEAQGASRVIPLDVSGAFHSSLMAPAAEKFEAEVSSVELKEAVFPVVSNVDGKPVTAVDQMRANLSKQITSSVQWVASIEHIASNGVDTFFEIGPGNVLKGLLRKINHDLTVHNIRTPEDLEKL